MTNFTLVKKNLTKIIELNQNVLGDKLNGHVQGYFPSHSQSLLVADIFTKLIDYPKGQSISKGKNTQIIMLSVLTLDELVPVLDKLTDENATLLREQYIEFRFKAFSLFVQHDIDAEAAELYNHLPEVIDRLALNSSLREKLKQQVKNYRRVIARKIKELERQKQFDKASLLNTLYGMIPDYIFEKEVEENERKHLKWHFLDPFFEIVVGIVVVLLVYGINLLMIKKDENHDVFAFFANGNFDFYELLFGFALIFLMFWLFKLIDHQRLKTLWRNTLKGLLLLAAVLAIYGYVYSRYENEFESYFPGPNNKEVLRGDYDDGKTRVLVTKFMPLEKSTIFNKDYSDINISQLFYKKMLAQTIDEKGELDSTLIIDYYPDNFNIKNREDLQRLYDQGKYDVIISGDFIKQEKDFNIFSSLYITDSSFLMIVEKLRNNQIVNKIKDENVNNLDNISLNDFFGYIDKPFDYYKRVNKLFDFSKDPTLLKSDLPCGFEFNIETDFSPQFTIINTIQKSPLICINFIKILKTMEIDFSKLTNEKCDTIIKCINEILLWNNEGNDSTTLKQNILNLNMYQLNSLIYNKKVELTKGEDQFENWVMKVEFINKSIEILCKIDNRNELTCKRTTFINSFSNYAIIYLLSKNEVASNSHFLFKKSYKSRVDEILINELKQLEIIYRKSNIKDNFSIQIADFKSAIQTISNI